MGYELSDVLDMHKRTSALCWSIRVVGAEKDMYVARYMPESGKGTQDESDEQLKYFTRNLPAGNYEFQSSKHNNTPKNVWCFNVGKPDALAPVSQMSGIDPALLDFVKEQKRLHEAAERKDPLLEEIKLLRAEIVEIKGKKVEMSDRLLAFGDRFLDKFEQLWMEPFIKNKLMPEIAGTGFELETIDEPTEKKAMQLSEEQTAQVFEKLRQLHELVGLSLLPAVERLAGLPKRANENLYYTFAVREFDENETKQFVKAITVLFGRLGERLPPLVDKLLAKDVESLKTAIKGLLQRGPLSGTELKMAINML